MPCRYYRSDDGQVTGIICSSRRRSRACSVCKRPSDRLCDYPDTKHKSGTCDKPLCSECARHVGPDRDHCPSHLQPTASPNKKLAPLVREMVKQAPAKTEPVQQLLFKL